MATCPLRLKQKTKQRAKAESTRFIGHSQRDNSAFSNCVGARVEKEGSILPPKKSGFQTKKKHLGAKAHGDGMSRKLSGSHSLRRIQKKARRTLNSPCSDRPA
jgi:hypothetical protein